MHCPHDRRGGDGVSDRLVCLVVGRAWAPAGATPRRPHSFVATCTANGRDPLAYVTDILGRIGSHWVARLDELLPQSWHPPA